MDPRIPSSNRCLICSLHPSRVQADHSYYGLSPTDFPLCSVLMQRASIGRLEVDSPDINDRNAPSIINLISRSKSLKLDLLGEMQLSDPAAFITQLYSLPVIEVRLTDYSTSSFFGLPHSFWQRFLNEKLWLAGVLPCGAHGEGDEGAYGSARPKRRVDKVEEI
ncbi:hypothetical protein PMAYCL1PPCAC_02272 [Pristionchus mayeri]|uniref:Uncharacterized protein n=1 Tax=Pristionchus mayeri TaxID=1317129 RepID=A0AAN4Z027_9BILA|nr:hypothetical protein PMAYCL1PPCAC_02272 [Pristionchus mayeri]